MPGPGAEGLLRGEDGEARARGGSELSGRGGGPGEGGRGGRGFVLAFFWNSFFSLFFFFFFVGCVGECGVFEVGWGVGLVVRGEGEVGKGKKSWKKELLFRSRGGSRNLEGCREKEGVNEGLRDGTDTRKSRFRSF